MSRDGSGTVVTFLFSKKGDYRNTLNIHRRSKKLNERGGGINGHIPTVLYSHAHVLLG